MTGSDGVFPLTTISPSAPFDDLEPVRGVVGDAAVVGIARGAHGTTELTQLSHRLVRYLVGELGFRTLAIEASSAAAIRVDEWLHHGRGELGPLLRGADPWWRTEAFEDVLRWLLHFNHGHADDPVGLVGVESEQPTMDSLEQAMAAAITAEHTRSGRRIVYWSGSHSAVGHRRRVRWREESPRDAGSRNAGSYLREQFDDRYRSLALSFRHGTSLLGGAEVDVPAAPSDYLGTMLGPHGLALHVLRPGHEVADRPLRFRLVGPFHDPRRPAEMSGGTVSTFFDAALHVDEVSATRPPPDDEHPA